MGFWEVFGIWLAAVFTIGIISFLYRDNVLYKVCESIFVGVSAGYWFIIMFWDNLYRKGWLQVRDNPAGSAEWIVAIVGVTLGVLMLTRLINKIGWIARWPLSFIVGATAGVYMVVFFVSNAMKQIAATILPAAGTPNAHPIFIGSAPDIIANVVIAIGTFSGLVYFFFSKEHKGAFGGAAKLGIWFLMITFGASFGYTVMSRMSLMIGRLDFLFGRWLEMIL
jgi:energy-converting hydrogenase Eha subunit C